MAFSAPDLSAITDPPQPYGGSVTLQKALAGEVLLAWAMNGQSIPRVHGAPVPGYIGARSLKWIERITVQDVPSSNYFQARAYRLLPPVTDPALAGPGVGLPPVQRRSSREPGTPPPRSSPSPPWNPKGYVNNSWARVQVTARQINPARRDHAASVPPAARGQFHPEVSA